MEVKIINRYHLHTFKNIGKKNKAPAQCEHCKAVVSHKNSLYKHSNKSKRYKKLREIFAKVAVFALIAAETDSNVSAILANIYIQILQLYLNIELV